MDEGETVSKLDRKELRKQKLMEYLAAKGKLKPLNPKPYLRDFAHVSTTSVVTVNMNTGKENQGPNAVKVKKEGGKIQPLSVKAASQASGVLRRGTAQKTTRTNNNKPEPDKTLCPQTVTVASLTARIDALKSIAQSAGPRRLANQKQALTEKITTAAQAAGQPRVQFNQSAAVLAQPSHNQAPAKAESRKTHPTMSVRMSIGTVAKTKTGLIPSVTPQSSVSVLNASTRTRVPSRGHTDSSPPASVSQEASLRLRKALPIRTVSQSQVTWGTESRSLIARPPQLRGQRPSVTASRNAQQTTVRSNPAPRRPGVKVQPNLASGRPGVKVQPNPAPGRPGVKVQSNPAPRKPGVKVQPNPAPGRPGVKVQSNPAPRKPGVKVQPNPAPGRPGVKVQSNPAPRKPGVKVQPNPAPGRPGVKVQPNPAPGRPGVKVQPNPAPGRPGVKVLETYSKPPIRPAQKTKRILPLGALKPAQPASTGTSNQWQAKALSRAMQAAVAERVQKDSVPLADGQDMGSDNISSKLIPCKRTTAAGARELAVPQTVPRAARPASQGRWAGCVKTQVGQGTAVPQTEGKKYMTAAQEERMRKLQEWREARGISYKRPPMPVKPRVRCPAGPSQPYWASIEQEEETQALVHAVDRSLDDCIALLLEGCPVSQVQGVLSRLPAVAQKFAKFWICQARLMEREGNLDVLPMFEEAVRVVLEPVDELRAVVFDILRKKDNIQDHTPERGVEDARAPGQGLSPSESPMEPISLPKPVGALIHGDQGCSSVVKYKITATPGGFRSQQREPVRVDGHELRFFTPVRRSVRIERSSRRYPAALQDHDLCVTSYQELVGRGEMGGDGEGGEVEGCSPQMNPTVYVYRENDALRGQVHMQLVYDD